MNFVIPTKVDDLRSKLLEFGLDEKVVSELSKAKLKEIFVEKMTELENNNSSDDTNEFNIRFEENDINDENLPSTKQECLPKYGSPEWQSYVLSLLTPEEQIDGYPRCFGLRRIAQELLGPIISSKPIDLNVVPRINDNGESSSRATTVVYEVIIDWQLDRPIYLNMNSNKPISDYRTFGGTADCVEDPASVFGRHPAASAETKAESRALKKALCLNVLSAEEKVSGYDEDGPKEEVGDTKISKQLISFIEAKIKALNLKPENVLASNGFDASTKFTNLSMEEGRRIFRWINKEQQT